MAIFNNGPTPEKYHAYLNWMFDDGNGRMDSDVNAQNCWDFKQMGNAYLKNAEVVLSYLLEQGPDYTESDTMIFPVMFNVWHGVELLLKSGNIMCDLYLGQPVQNYSKHTIDAYSDQFRSKMKKLGFTKIDSQQLKGLVEFVDECKAKNAHFDFARYTMQSDGNKQFYNTPDSEGFVRNVTVDLLELARVLVDISDGFVDTIDYLYEHMSIYGTDRTHLNTAALKQYCESDVSFDHLSEETQYTVAEVAEKYKKLMEASGSKGQIDIASNIVKE